MSERRKIILESSIGIIFIFLLVFFINERNKTTVLEFGMFVGSNWDVANANSYTIIDKAIERFEKEHPNVKVHYNSGILKEDYSEWLSQKLLSGDMPDVYMVLASDFDQYASIGALKDLSNLMGSDPDFNKKEYYQTVLDTGKYESNQYALPYETVPALMFVNKTLLEKEGIQVPGSNWTWNELYKICSEVTKDTNQDGTLDQFGVYNYDWTEAVYANGASLFDTNGENAYFSDDKVAQAISFVRKIEELNRGQTVTQEDFDNGNVAFMPLLFSDYRTYKTYPYKIKKYTNFQWDCITLPAGEQGKNTSEVSTLLLGLSSKTKKVSLAWEFLKLLTYDEESQMDIFRYSQGASVLKKVTESKEAEAILQQDMEESEKVIDRKLLSQVLEEGMITPKFPKYTDAMALADSEITQILVEDKNIDSALKILQRSINRYLAQ